MTEKETKKSSYRWKTPLLMTVICIALEVSCAAQIDGSLLKLLFTKAIFAFIGLGIVYNWSLDKVREKPSKIEIILVLPLFALIVFAVVPPFIYVRQRLLTAGLLVMGVEFTAFGLGYWFQETRLKRICTGRATAVVLDNVVARTDTRPGEASTKTYFPVLSYDVNGRHLELQFEHGLLRPMDLGQRIEIGYNPQNIEEFCFLDQRKNTALTFGVPMALVFAAGLLTAAALSVVFQWSV